MKQIRYGLKDLEGFRTFINFLNEYIDQSITLVEDENPEYLFCSCFGRSFLNENAIRIVYIGENLAPDFNVYDYAIGFHNIEFEDRYIRYPIYAFAYRKSFLEATKKHLVNHDHLSFRDKFCGFVVSNGSMEDIRTQFFLELSKYKMVDSGGRFLNNTGTELIGVDGKKSFQSRCKFAIAFENSSSTGYTTEKLLEAWQAGCIPIYWGNPEISKEFNAKSFINCHDFLNFQEVIEYIKRVDTDDELYYQILHEPILFEGCIAEKYLDTSYLKKFLNNIFLQDREKAVRRISFESKFAKYYEKTNEKVEKVTALRRVTKKIVQFLGR